MFGLGLMADEIVTTVDWTNITGIIFQKELYKMMLNGSIPNKSSLHMKISY